MDEKDLKQIEVMMTRVVGVFAEDIQHKLDLLVEGQQALHEKLESTRAELKANIGKVDHRLTTVEARHDQRFDALEQKVDGIAANLDAHRHDTEAHRGWRIREE